MELTVAELIDRFDSGEIRLPLMQRDYVWKARKVVALLDSLYRGWPIGSFYVWQTQDSHLTRERAGGFAPMRRLDGFYGFLLDGQQRLTSLSLAIQRESEGDLSTRAFFDLETQTFVLGTMTRRTKKRIEDEDPLLIPLSELAVLTKEDEDNSHETIEEVIQKLEHGENLGRGNAMESEFRRRLQRAATMFRRRALCEEFRDDDEEHAFELFARLNKGGTSLQTGDVAAARLASTGTREIVGPMRAVVAEREMRTLGLNFVFVLRTLITVHRGSCSFSRLPKNWAENSEEVQQSWRETEKALRFVVQFVLRDMGWKTRRWLPSTMALIPLVFTIAKFGAEPFENREATVARRYLLIAGLRSLFQGAAETTVNSYVNAVRDSAGNRARRLRGLAERIPRHRRMKLKRDDFLASARTHSPLIQIYLTYLREQNAKSWPSGSQLLSEDIQEKPVVVHHVFPKTLAGTSDLTLERLNCVANYVILTATDDTSLSGESPLESWNRMKLSEREIAEVQLGVGNQSDLLKESSCEHFLEHRAQKLAAMLNEFLAI